MDGKQITRSICQVVHQARYEYIGIGEKFSNRQWFIEPLKDGKIHFSDFYTSRIANALCITVSGPTRNDIGEIVGILMLDMRIEELIKSDEA